MPNLLTLTPAQFLNAQFPCRRYRNGRLTPHQLIPRKSADGTKLCIGSNALVDPAYEDARAILQGGTVENVASYSGTEVFTEYRHEVNAKSMLVRSDGKSHSITAPASNQLDFELHFGDQGDQADPVGNRHRSELVAVSPFSGTPTLWAAWAFKVRRMGVLALPGSFGVVGQWHGVDPGAGRTPPFQFNIGEGKLRVYTSSSLGELVLRYAGSVALVEEQWYQTVVQFIPGASGTLKVYLDSVAICNFSPGGGNAIPLGYYLDASPGYNFQGGLYKCDRLHPDLQAQIALGNLTQSQIDLSDLVGNVPGGAVAGSSVRYANMEFGTTDLSARILTPIAP